MLNIRLPRVARLGIACLIATGCASTKSQVTEQDISGPMPRPDRILVFNFAFSPGQVRLDRGISAELAQAAKGEARSTQELAVGQKVSDTVAEHLVQEIRKMGLAAQRAAGHPNPHGNSVSIEGQFLSIDEGNRTERVAIGLGMGRTKVQTVVQVYRESRDGQQLLEKVDVAAKSGRKPGAAETMGAGAAVGNLAASTVVTAGLAGTSEILSANVEADGVRTAKEVAKELQKFFVREGWVTP